MGGLVTLSALSADLDAESTVTPEDRARAPRFWAQWGTRLLRALLGAKEEK